MIVGPGISEKIPEDKKLGGRMRIVEQFVDVANRLKLSCVVMHATVRGPGSRCQDYGEIDVLEASEDCCRKYPIDRDRISIHGHSMRGAAVFYLVSHYPDMLSSAVPTAGYCDYRLWEKPGGPVWPEALRVLRARLAICSSTIRGSCMAPAADRKTISL